MTFSAEDLEAIKGRLGMGVGNSTTADVRMLIAAYEALQGEHVKATGLIGDLFKTDYDAAVIERKRATTAEAALASAEERTRYWLERAEEMGARVAVLRDAAAIFAGAVFRSACAKTSATPALFDAHDDFMKVLSTLDSSADRLTGEMEALRELAAAVMDGGPSSKREAAALCAWEKATK